MYIHLKDIVEIWMAPQVAMVVLQLVFAVLEYARPSGNNPAISSTPPSTSIF